VTYNDAGFMPGLKSRKATDEDNGARKGEEAGEGLANGAEM